MINNKKILSVVISRKGSKGIKNKNFRNLMGLPLFMWSVEASIKSKYIDKTIVSSNCPNCKEIFDEYKKMEEFLNIDNNVEWVQRPEEISGDLSKNEEAVIHAINYEKEKYNNDYSIGVNLQATSPIRNNNLIDSSLEKYYNGGYDSLISGKKDTPFIWQKINGKWKYIVDKNHCCDRKMRQQFLDDENNSEMIFHDGGNLYFSNIDMLLKTRCRIGNNPIFIETDKLQSIQIDTEEDFILIEKMAEAYNLNSLV
jgi:CMP-N,N'-diacetyllegionaminic acid synthase